MDGMDSTVVDSPSDALTPGINNPSSYAYDNLQTYLHSVPYQCETNEAMQEKLQHLVGKLVICAEARDWRSLSIWGGVLQCWLIMKYPLPKPTRVNLVRLYYELILIPGAEPGLARGWADMLQRLLAEKPGLRRKLEPTDVELSWQSLWRILQKELWPNKVNASTHHMINLLLYVAEKCRRYYPARDIPIMLESFLPLLTKDTTMTMICVMISFLPPTHTHMYLPTIFKLWEATNSYLLDDRILELLGLLAEEHVAGKAGKAGAEGGTSWKDVGIFTTEQWSILVGKCLGSFHVPVASMKGPSNTGVFADAHANRFASKLKKSINRLQSLAQLFVYSMAVDGPVRSEDLLYEGTFLAGSKALDALDRLIMSTESFFHPSNSGPWTLSLTTFVKHVASDFLRRWKEEEDPDCSTPVTQRLTPGIRRSLVTLLRTPCFLAMFSKDLLSSSLAQMSLKILAILEPRLVMPQVIERAIEGLEVVNETHRTTAVLGLLAMVALPLANENVWLGGQKHLLTLLELALPGIDMNDPHKTMVSALFISAIAAQIKFGRATGPVGIGDDGPRDSIDMLDTGYQGDLGPSLGKAEERQLTRDSTYLFEEWVPSFLRQVFRLYENLPEEGGKGNKAGGKEEESMLSSIKTALDMVCQHLSPELFDAALRQTYNYVMTHARPNAVRAFGQLVSSLARVDPEKTINLFLLPCISRIEEELEHGASSIRTTSVHPASPADTVFHWNLTILRACLGYGGQVLLKYREKILSLLTLLVNHTKNERGYSGTGRLLMRILHNIGGVYTIEERFVNDDEWQNPQIDGEHPVHWGKLYDAQSVTVNWHVPTEGEIAFVQDILEIIASPCLDVIQTLLTTVPKWDDVARNDFCRHMQIVRSIWNALPTLIKEESKPIPNASLDDGIDIPELLFIRLDMEAGFTLSNPEDPRYKFAASQRKRYGLLLHDASIALLRSEAEDHIDAVIQISKGIDVYLLEYAVTRSTYSATAKAYQSRREGHRMWLKQKQFPRNVFIKRAQYYHHGRLYMHSLYRGRSELDDFLLKDLIEMSLSLYTRVRKFGQSVLLSVCSAYTRSTRFCLPNLLDALVPGTDPDRMKGALYTLGSKSFASYAMADGIYMGRYVLRLLECSHQDKSSIQDLVKAAIGECSLNVFEETLSEDGHPLSPSVFNAILEDITVSLSPDAIDKVLLNRMKQAAIARSERKETLYDSTVEGIISVARNPRTHWKYVQYALRLLSSFLRRNKAPTADMASLFIENICNPEPATRLYSQKAITKIMVHVKLRTFCGSSLQALWLEEYVNPLAIAVPISDPDKFSADLQIGQPGGPLGIEQDIFIDKLPTGFAVWGKSVKCYRQPPEDQFPFTWEPTSHSALNAISEFLTTQDWFRRVSVLWSQESNRTNSNADLRTENIHVIKVIAKIYGPVHIESVLSLVDSLCTDPDRFKQRAGAELLLGYTRGSKHWPRSSHRDLWEWVMQRMPRVFSLIKPDTRQLWESFFNLQLTDWDPRRVRPLMTWILSLPLEFKSDSAFAMGKTLSLFSTTVECLGIRFRDRTDEHLALLFEQAGNGFAEVREQIAQSIDAILLIKWHLGYTSTEEFLAACQEEIDPVGIRRAPQLVRILEFAQILPEMRTRRLAPPRVAHSEYDRTCMTLLHWIWNTGHSPHASSIFPYVLPLIPEFFYMSEMNDNAELVKYSMAVLFVLSSITPPSDYIEPISERMIGMIQTSQSWRVRQNALPVVLVFFYRNLAAFSVGAIKKILDAFIECLRDDNVEVRSTAAKVFAGVLRCSQRSQIPELQKRFLEAERKARLPTRSDPKYGEATRTLHSAILGLCALMDCYPYVVESWMPPLMEVFARHSTDPPPISTTVRAMASDFKKTHQDTWHTDKTAFTEEELQALNTILVGTSYYA